MIDKLFAALLLLACSGCATMINGRNEEVPVDSFPSGAKVAVDCGDVPRDGGATPARVLLARIAEKCSVTLTKDGYEPKVVTFHREESRAGVANKVAAAPLGFFAAITGYFLGSDNGLADDLAAAGWNAGTAAGAAPGRAVDKRTGGAYKQVPGEVYVTLVRLAQ